MTTQGHFAQSVRELVAHAISARGGIPQDMIAVVALPGSDGETRDDSLLLGPVVFGPLTHDPSHDSQVLVPDISGIVRETGSQRIGLVVFSHDTHAAFLSTASIARKVGLPSIRVFVDDKEWVTVTEHPVSEPLSNLASSTSAAQAVFNGQPFPLENIR